MVHFKRLLFVRDFSPASEVALPFALHFARRAAADLHLLFVDTRPSNGSGRASLAQTGEPWIHERLSDLGQIAGAGKLGTVRTVAAVGRDAVPARGISRYARSNGVDLIVVPTSGQPDGRDGISRIAGEIISGAPCPLLVVRAATVVSGLEASLRHLLAPVDFSHDALGAIGYAKELAESFGSRLDLLHVVDASSLDYPGLSTTPVLLRQAMEDAAGKLRRAYSEAEGRVGPVVRFEISVGRAAQEIVQYSTRCGCDLIVMGPHGRTGASRCLTGAVTEEVLRSAACPVLVGRCCCAESANPSEGNGHAGEA